MIGKLDVTIHNEHVFPNKPPNNMREEEGNVYDCVEMYLRSVGSPNAAWGHMTLVGIGHDLVIKLKEGQYVVLEEGESCSLKDFEDTFPRITHLITADFH